MDPVDNTQSPSSGAIEFLAWLEVNKKRLIIGAVVVVGVAAVVACYNYYDEQRNIKAGEALTALPGLIQGMSKAAPAKAQDYLKVARDYSGTPAAIQAQLLAAEALFTEGKFADAQAAFERFIQDNAIHPLVAHAAYGVAACLEASGKANDALNKYQEVSRQNTLDLSVSSLAKLNAARILESQGKFAQAHQVYRDMADLSRGQSFNMYVEEAQTRLNALEKAHPELIPPPPPPAPASAAPTPVLPGNLTVPSAPAPALTPPSPAPAPAPSAPKK